MKEYELSRNRYKELKHFCLQYHEMKEILEELDEQIVINRKQDPTAYLAIRRNEYAQAIKLIETTAFETEKILGGYILKSVSEDVSFSALKMPCPKYVYEYLREKFFWLLSERKGYS